MNVKLINSSLLITTLLTGFYAGTGFFGMMGGNPAITKMTSHTFAEFWQHTDFYMAARMKFFGPLLLLSLLSSILIHIGQYRTPAFWLLLTAFLILIIDVIVGFNINQPLNHLIQSWDLSNLPPDVQEIKHRVVNAFWIRNACMISCFICVLAAVFLRRK
jgi:hypothetical protein